MFTPPKRLRIALILLCSSVFLTFWLGFTIDRPRAQIQDSPRKLDSGGRSSGSDKVTSEARNASNNLFLVPVKTSADRVRASELGTVAQDFGSFLLVYADERVSKRRLGGGAQKLDTSIHLPGGSFEPLEQPMSSSLRRGRSSAPGSGYYVVQLAGIATDEALESIRALGLEIIQYVPNNAFFVYGDSKAAASVGASSRVRWIGQYAPDQKVSVDLKNRSVGSESETAMFNIPVFARADLDSVAEAILNASGGTLLAKMKLQSSYFNVVRVEMPLNAIDKVSAVEDIVAIDPYETPSIEDERSSQIIAGNYISTTSLLAPGYDPFTQFGVDGSNVTVGVVDDGVSIPGNGGFYITSLNTVNGPLRGASAGAEGGHGHLNASIIAGDSPFGVLDLFGYNYGLGVAPKTNLVNIPLLKSGYTSSESVAANDTVSTAGPNGVNATISNNSWGFGTNGNSYESLAATYDAFSRDASSAATVDPLLFVFSAGNSGASGLTRPKMAKNIIAVGNSENIRSVNLSGGGTLTGNNMDDLSNSSSRGPAVDGRIKPELVAPGSVITGGRAGDCSTITNCFDTNHVVSSGTSHAAPQVAGAAALFTDYWRSTHTGANPSIALTKAAILLTGQEMNGVGTGTAIPNGNEGWGRLNMKLMFNTGLPRKYVNETTTLSAPGEEISYTGEIIDGSKPFRATLVWTDPPGVVDPSLVNNLDLTVTIGGTVYRGNVFSGGLSVTGGVADIRNNVEQVWRSGETSGTPVTITVRATSLNGDGSLGNGDATDQHFALVVHNFAGRYNVAGRVVGPTGRGISSAAVFLYDGPTLVARALTNSFGYYRFTNVIGGSSYNMVVEARRYAFVPQLVNLDDFSLDGVDFTGSDPP